MSGFSMHAAGQGHADRARSHWISQCRVPALAGDEACRNEMA